MTHTPGPWTVHDHGGFIRVNNSVDDDGHFIEFGPVAYDGSHAARISDARLIACAPTMYEYIKGKAIEGDSHAAEIIKAIE